MLDWFRRDSDEKRSSDGTHTGPSGAGSETEWGAEQSGTEWGSDRADVTWSAEESETTQERDAGRQNLPTLGWEMGVLRESPALLVLALAASSLELFVLQSNFEVLAVGGGVLRWGLSFLGTVVVAAVAAVVAEDAFEDRQRSIVTQIGAVLRALPALMMTIGVIAFVLYFGVFLPISFFRFVGFIIGTIIGVYLLALFYLVVPAVVLDQSIRQGRRAFGAAGVLAMGLLLVVALGHAPLLIITPTLSEPVLATGLAVWTGLVIGLVPLAYTRVYFTYCPEKDGQAESGGPNGRAAGGEFLAKVVGEGSDY